MVLNRYTIRGPIVGTRQDLEEALAFAAEGKNRATIETLALEFINDVFTRLRPTLLRSHKPALQLAARRLRRDGR
jgi:propanol-preferring alcohol dehydrogenase